MVFNPTAFDADQLIDSAKLAGMRGLILTCKHHDGFCLWPSKFTEHSVRNSPFRNGKGDVVREVEQACRRAGLEFGVYLSPWDRNHAAYGSPEYITYFRSQLRELLTEYGEIFEVWFDGANGGDGYYGGANEKRSIDNSTYYDWEKTFAMVRELQPKAVMFSDAGPDVRWNGNEAGVAGDPYWCTIHTEGTYPGHADHQRLNCGDRDGQTWLIPECDVSIRPGWFYHALEDHSVRSARNLVDLYFASVGRGTTFLLNLPPDRRGLIPEVDRQSLRGFRSHLDTTFSHNVAAGHSRSLGWQTIDGQRQWVIEINLPDSLQTNVIELREDIRLGHRVDQWVLETCDAANHWQELATVQSVGARRFVRFASQSATKFRVRITEASDEPVISDVGLYFEPELTEHRAQTTNEIAARVTHKTGDEIVLDLQETMPLLAVRYTPDLVHRVSKYEIAFADVAGQWRDPIAGEFGNVQFNAAPQLVACNTRARYVRFHAKQFCKGDALAGNEVNVLRV
jgi:alpha-L-fucosidase